MRVPLLLVLALSGCLAAPAPAGPEPAAPAPEPAAAVAGPEDACALCGSVARSALAGSFLSARQPFELVLPGATIRWQHEGDAAPPLLRPGDPLDLRLDLGLPADVPPETVARISWDFGDGARDRGGALRHAWAAPGSWKVTARAVGLADPTSVYEASVVVGVLREETWAGRIPFPDTGACAVPGTTCVEVPLDVPAGQLALEVVSSPRDDPPIVVSLLPPSGNASGPARAHVVAQPESGIWLLRLHLERAWPARDVPYEVTARVHAPSGLSEANRDGGAPGPRHGRSV